MKKSFFYAGKLVLALSALLAVSGTFLWADSPDADGMKASGGTEGIACEYEGEDLELFNRIKDTTWYPKLKGFLEVTNPFAAILRKSDRMTFRPNGKVWFKIGSTGAVMPYSIRDGMIIIENRRFAYSAEFDKIVDLVAGSIYTRVGTKPDASENSVE